jgi:hypothetical protein
MAIGFVSRSKSERTVQEPAPTAYVIDLTKPLPESAWEVLRTSAMATGAFPVFLKPRVLLRKRLDYTPPLWESMGSVAQGTPPPLSPTFPVGLSDPFETLNVDGGVTNNDPYNYAHDYLASLAPPISGAEIPSEAHQVDRAVLSIAPFPTTDTYSTKYDTGKNSSVLSALPHLFSVLVSQSRFFGEDLSKAMAGTSFSNFIVAPSDDQLVQKDLASPSTGKPLAPALQCASLGAFGGFFERGFRAHDYALGRRNCQKFLRDHFVLPANNPIIRSGLPDDQSARERLIQQFKRPAPPGQPDADWLPIIPLCTTSVLTPISSVPRVQIDRKKLNIIVSLILRRFRAVVTTLLDPIPAWPLRIFLKIGQPVITFLARQPLTKALIQQLGDSYRP